MNGVNIYDLFSSPEDVQQKIQEACAYLKKGNFITAETMFSELFKKSVFRGDVETGIVCSKYWKTRLDNIKEMSPGLSRADFILEQWAAFKSFLKSENRRKKEYDNDVITYSGHSLISLAIEDLISAYKKRDYPDTELLLSIGESFIELPDYKKAIETLEYARVYRKKDPCLLALLADSYFLYGEIRRAKVLFREAFFLNPEAVPLSKIKSPLIHDIICAIKENGIEHIAPWVSVYALISGKFDVQKELSEEEASDLIGEVRRLEHEYYATKNLNFKPYLISKYLYLIEYLEHQVGSKSDADKLKTKVKVIDQSIYMLYSEYEKNNKSAAE
jgi:hypothetical protein